MKHVKWKRYLAFLLTLSLVLQYSPALSVQAYHTEENDQSKYRQLKGTVTLEKGDSFTFDPPTKGIILFNDLNYCYDNPEYTGNYRADYHAGIIEDAQTLYYNGSSSSSLFYWFYPICPVYYYDGDEIVKLADYIRWNGRSGYIDSQYSNYNNTNVDGSKARVIYNTYPGTLRYDGYSYHPIAKFALPDGVKRGYTFNGWYNDEALTDKITEIDTAIGAEWYLYPDFTPDEYKITYYNTDGATNPNPDTYTIESGIIKLQPAEKDGYTLVRWYVTESGQKKTVTEIDSQDIKDQRLYAEWIDAYNITYENGYTHSNPATYTVLDSEITLEDATRTGYDFAGWYEDTELEHPVETIDCSKATALTVYAKWTPTDYELTYELDGGTNAETNPATYNIEDSGVTLAPATKKGYTFAGWYLKGDADKTYLTEIDPATCQDLTLCADYTENSYTITYKDGCDHANPETCKVTDGTLTLKDASRDGYQFLGWYADKELTDKITSIDCTQAQNVTVYAGWKLLTYDITYVLNGGTNDVANKTTYSAEDAFELKDPVKKGYDFDGWYADSDYTKKVEDAGITVFRSMTLYAKWKEHAYQITYTDAYEHSNPASYRMTGEPLVPADAKRDGYAFAGWYTDSGLENKVTSIDRTQAVDVDLYAKWELEQYSITYHLGGGENAEENVDGYSAENPAVFVDPSRTGYDFKGWYLDEEYTKQVAKAGEKVFGDLDLYAKWEPHSYQITYVDSGSHENPKQYTVEDEELTLAAAQRDGYRFLGWYADASYETKVDVLDCTQAQNVTLYARWENEIYKIQYELSGGTNALENITQYTIETEFVLKNPSRTGYDFAGWYLDDAYTQAVEVVGGKRTGDLTLYAKWELHTYTVAYVNGDEAERPTQYTVSDGELALSDAEKDGKEFLGWYTDEALTAKVTAIDCSKAQDLTLYAGWKNSVYQITYELDGGENNTRNIKEYTMDTVFPLKDAVKTGYDFAGWYLDPEDDEPVTEINQELSGDITLYAAWTVHTYTITYEDGKDNGNPKTYTVLDKEITLTDAAQDGKEFLGWYADGVFTTQVSAIDCTQAKDVTLYAKWRNRIYNIRYELDGGENDPDNPSQYTTDNAAELLDPERDDYDFAGWFKDSGFTEEITKLDQETGDLILYAKWEPHSYQIQYVDAYTHENPASYTVEDGSISLKNAQREGCLFTGWYTDENRTKRVTAVHAEEYGNVTLYAGWTTAKYVVAKNSQKMGMSGKDAVATLEIACPCAGYLELKNENAPGCKKALFAWNDGEEVDSVSGFSGMVERGTYMVSLKSITENQYTTVSYTFRPTCTVYYYADASEVKPLLTYQLSDTKTMLELPVGYTDIEGYTVSEWYQDAALTGAVSQVNTADGTDWYLYPIKVPTVYHIEYELNGGTNHAENPPQYTIEDGAITLKAPEKTGSVFKRWYTFDGAEKVTVTAVGTDGYGDRKLYAEWETADYTITYNDGYTHSNPETYTIYDPVIMLKKAERNGFVFGGWYAEEELETAVTSIDTGWAEDVSLYAKWIPETYSISYELNGGVNAEENADSFTPLTIFTVGDPVRENYDFEGWYLDAGFEIAFVALDVPVCRDVTLYAKWEPHAYEITYELDGGTNSSDNPDTYTVEDKALALEEPEKDGYDFVGWYTLLDEEKTYQEAIDPSWKEDVTLYAEWKPVSQETDTEPSDDTKQQEETPSDDTKQQEQTPSGGTAQQGQTPSGGTAQQEQTPSKVTTQENDDEDDDDEDDNEEKKTAKQTEIKIPAVSKVKSVKATAKKKALKVTWKSQSGAAGYQLQASLKKSFTGAKTITVKKTAKSYTIKKLKTKKKYYVRVRAYKTYKDANGKTKSVYGKWTVVTKKTK